MSQCSYQIIVDYDQNTCDSGGPSQPDYKCVDAGNYDIRGYTVE